MRSVFHQVSVLRIRAKHGSRPHSARQGRKGKPTAAANRQVANSAAGGRKHQTSPQSRTCGPKVQHGMRHAQPSTSGYRQPESASLRRMPCYASRRCCMQYAAPKGTRTTKGAPQKCTSQPSRRASKHNAAGWRRRWGNACRPPTGRRPPAQEASKPIFAPSACLTCYERSQVVRKNRARELVPCERLRSMSARLEPHMRRKRQPQKQTGNCAGRATCGCKATTRNTTWIRSPSWVLRGRRPLRADGCVACTSCGLQGSGLVEPAPANSGLLLCVSGGASNVHKAAGIS